MNSLPPIFLYIALWLILLGALVLVARLLAGSPTSEPSHEDEDVAPEAPEAGIVPLWGVVTVVCALLLAACVALSSPRQAAVPILLIVLLAILVVHAVRRGPERT